MPFETIVDFVFLPRWIIFVPGVGDLRVVRQGDRVKLADRLSPWNITLGYFHVMAEPVSTCVHEIFELTPRHAPRLVTKL